MPSNHVTRAYQCKTCGGRFTKKEHLARHVRSHTKEKPFACQTCGKRYSRRDILTRHQRDVRCKHPRTVPGETSIRNAEASQPTTDVSGPTSPTTRSGAASSRLRDSELAQGMLCSVASQHPVRADALYPSLPEVSGNARVPVVVAGPVDGPGGVVNNGIELSGILLDTFCGEPSVQFAPGYMDLNSSLPSWNIGTETHEEMLRMDLPFMDELSVREGPAPPVPNTASYPAQRVEELWFFRLPNAAVHGLYPERDMEPVSGPATGPPSPGPGKSSEIDDHHRRSLGKCLQIMPYEPTVPSTVLLNFWIRLYFSRVHCVFPIIHAPTFVPHRSNANLVLALCAVGSLFTGSERGYRHGINLFERTHKATIMKWEHLSARDPEIMKSIIQSALISQMFGMLAGDPALLLTVDAFHGPPIAWARQERLRRELPPVVVDPDVNGSQLDDLWRQWASQEELIRLAHGLYTIDAELSNLFHREPLQSFSSYRFSFTSSEAVFMAPNSHEWKARYLAEMQQRQGYPSSPQPHLISESLSLQQVPLTSSFAAYSMLEGIGMRVFNHRAGYSNTPGQSVQGPQPILGEFYQRFLTAQAQACHAPLHLTVLWHAVAMSILVDFDLLERVVGRESSRFLFADVELTRQWAWSGHARSCVGHALEIKNQMQSINVVTELPVHVPRAVFWACLVLFCYIRYRLDGEQHSQPPSAGSHHCEGMSVVGISQSVLHDLDQPASSQIAALKSKLFAMIDILHHIGHWGISRRFADILTEITHSAFGNK